MLVASEQTGIEISVTTMGRVLKDVKARLGKPKPKVKCPLSDRHKRRRLAKIHQLLDDLPENEIAFYEDEVDIHLNPKIGLDWMAHGHQREVMTPGQNQKAYIAGALNATDGTIEWVGGVSKNSPLFVELLEKLHSKYTAYSAIHIVLDNYGIHTSREVVAALKKLSRIRLHFLPPYCPDENRIERLWQDLHANVTRNHRHTHMIALCADVADYLDHASPWGVGLARPPRRLSAAA